MQGALLETIRAHSKWWVFGLRTLLWEEAGMQSFRNISGSKPESKYLDGDWWNEGSRCDMTSRSKISLEEKRQQLSMAQQSGTLAAHLNNLRTSKKKFHPSPYLRDFDLMGLSWCQSICIFKRSPGDSNMQRRWRNNGRWKGTEWKNQWLGFSSRLRRSHQTRKFTSPVEVWVWAQR